MRVVTISDTHLQHGFKVPDGDLLIHAGDATIRGNLGELAIFAAWFSELPHQHKVFVPGNHDRNLEGPRSPSHRILRSYGIEPLMDGMVTLDGWLKVYGTPWTPRHGHGDWAFHYDRDSDEATAIWSRVPDGLDVLVTHGPPAGIGDHVARTRTGREGCAALRDAVVRTKPRYHVFGHLHEGYGRYDNDWWDTVYINAAVCDDNYEPTHEPIVFDIERVTADV